MATHQDNTTVTLDSHFTLRDVKDLTIETESGMVITIHDASKVKIRSSTTNPPRAALVSRDNAQSIMRRLPIEIRKSIWELAIPEMRSFVADGASEEDDYSLDKTDFMIAIPSSTVLQICRESRQTVITFSKRELEALLDRIGVPPVFGKAGQFHRLESHRRDVNFFLRFVSFPRKRLITFDLWVLVSFYYMQARERLHCEWDEIATCLENGCLDPASNEVEKALYLVP